MIYHHAWLPNECITVKMNRDATARIQRSSFVQGLAAEKNQPLLIMVIIMACTQPSNKKQSSIIIGHQPNPTANNTPYSHNTEDVVRCVQPVPVYATYMART
jgi:hypothetical protein